MLPLVLGVAAAVTTVPCFVFAAECFAATALGEDQPTAAFKRLPAPASGGDVPRPRVAVLIPAHDEAAQIADVVAKVKAQLQPEDRLLVVADNCTDATASEARAAGAEVVERIDPEQRGKGFALACGVAHLMHEPPQVVIIVDADCDPESGAIETLARSAFHHGQAVQADYLLTAEPGAPAKRRLVAFAVLVKNRVRPLGAARLGWPCQLTGSGMAFPWAELEAAAGELGGNIVEDMILGVNLTLSGRSPRFEPLARVTSHLPKSDAGASSQRSRWETGHLATLVSQVPRLLRAGARGDSRALGLGLDLAVPPLSLLVMLQGGMVVVTAASVAAGAWVPLLIAGSGGAALAAGVVRAWSRFGRQTITASELLTVPGYMLSKLPMYVRAALRGQERTWVRTARDEREAS